jgi:hypothetical protein
VILFRRKAKPTGELTFLFPTQEMIPLADRGPYRVDVQPKGAKCWVPMEPDQPTLKEAEDYAQQFSSSVMAWRIVPADHPTRERVNYDTSALAGFPTVKLSW